MFCVVSKNAGSVSSIASLIKNIYEQTFALNKLLHNYRYIFALQNYLKPLKEILV
jgi:hypothetical protein